jgi:hypothetical protein
MRWRVRMSKYYQQSDGAIIKDGKKLNPYFYLAEFQELEARVQDLEAENAKLKAKVEQIIPESMNELKAEGIEEMLNEFDFRGISIGWLPIPEYIAKLREGENK